MLEPSARVEGQGSSAPLGAARVGPPDRAAAERAIEALLGALGHPIEGELVGTPERVAAAWADELLGGYAHDPEAIAREGAIDAGAARGGLVVLRELSVTTMCPHHLLPAEGRATVAFLTRERVLGLGTVAQVVHACSRRLVLQEALGASIADALARGLDAEGVLVKLTMRHACLRLRGEREREASVETLSLAGAFAEPGSPARALALAALAHEPPERAR
jgi:GTP cyclohydrolase I